MDDKIYIKYGALDGREKMPSLNYNKELGCEIAYHTDEEALYVGTSEGNKKLCSAKDVAEINSKIDEINTSLTSINEQISSIIARLGESETPNE